MVKSTRTRRSVLLTEIQQQQQQEQATSTWAITSKPAKRARKSKPAASAHGKAMAGAHADTRSKSTKQAPPAPPALDRHTKAQKSSATPVLQEHTETKKSAATASAQCAAHSCPVRIGSVVYESVTAAAAAIGKSKTTLRRWCQSTAAKYADYQYVVTSKEQAGHLLTENSHKAADAVQQSSQIGILQVSDEHSDSAHVNRKVAVGKQLVAKQQNKQVGEKTAGSSTPPQDSNSSQPLHQITSAAQRSDIPQLEIDVLMADTWTPMQQSQAITRQQQQQQQQQHVSEADDGATSSPASLHQAITHPEMMDVVAGNASSSPALSTGSIHPYTAVRLQADVHQSERLEQQLQQIGGLNMIHCAIQLAEEHPSYALAAVREEFLHLHGLVEEPRVSKVLDLLAEQHHDSHYKLKVVHTLRDIYQQHGEVVLWNAVQHTQRSSPDRLSHIYNELQRMFHSRDHAKGVLKEWEPLPMTTYPQLESMLQWEADGMLGSADAPYNDTLSSSAGFVDDPAIDYEDFVIDNPAIHNFWDATTPDSRMNLERLMQQGSLYKPAWHDDVVKSWRFPGQLDSTWHPFSNTDEPGSE